ncbi:MAG TPA: tetratricopeptide repeat protein [Ramlibacter sp.]|nr:tetratricopeptide repeat protein [Ramlibacter sp.]
MLAWLGARLGQLRRKPPAQEPAEPAPVGDTPLAGEARQDPAGPAAVASLAAAAAGTAVRPDDPDWLAELALAALAGKRLDEAAALLQRALGTGARIAKAHGDYAASVRASQPAQAIRHYRAAIVADPRHAVAHADLGALLKDQGRAGEAAPLLERALQLDPGRPEPAYNLAMLRMDAGDWNAAGGLLDQYLAGSPKDADAHYWRGNAWMGQGDAAAARASYAAALRGNGRFAQARWGLAMAQLPALPLSATEQSQGLQSFGRELDALQKWCRTQAGADGFRAVGAQQPFYLAYAEQDHRAVLQKYGALCSSLQAGWARRMGVPPPAAKRPARLKVGIVSAHIHSHSVWHALLRGWIEHLDRGCFELHLFHIGAASDGETVWAGRHARLQQGLGEWTAWAKAISDARLDALIYPEVGMDATTLRLASLRLARVQLAGWGHPLTTGLPTVDGYLSAAAFEPEGAQDHYSERLVALPRLGCAYRPYGARPQPVDLTRWGIAPRDRLLLCPGVPFKYAPCHDALWVAIARRCAPCKLVFFRPPGAHGIRLEQRLRAVFAAAGQDFDAAVRFLPWQPQPAFFGLLQRAEVFLDTVGFSGFNTVMQAVECGTPVVTWEGAFMRGRFGSAVLRALDLERWIARTHEAYADRVVQLCGDANLREAVKQQLRAQAPSLYDDQASVAALGAELERLCA